MISLRPRRRRDRGAADPRDRGSLPMALLVTLVSMSLSAVLVPVVVNQITTNRVLDSRNDALQAAQSGIDAALGQLRRATNAAGKGDLEQLPPCLLTGNADLDEPGTLPRLRYRVTITYYRAPTDGTAQPQAQGCPPTDVPITAQLTATGGRTDAAAGPAPGSTGTRTLDATYTFKTNNENITGGAIRLAAPTANPLCMDAGSETSPAAGTAVTMQPCKSGGSSDQRFAYTADLSIRLVGSETVAAPKGMCLDAPLPHANGTAVTFQPCLDRTPRQQWSLDNSSQFRDTPNGVGLGSFCFNLENNVGAAGRIVLGACNSVSNKTIFRPQDGVGAGMASINTGQVVNYRQFSRCLDVTDHVPTRPYMIVWFCKQAPDGNVSWNQKWTLPPVTTSADNAVAERIRTAGTNNPGYCLRSPGSTAANQYVTMSPCALTGELTDPALKWTMYGDTGDYATSYRIVDSYGYCLTPTDLTVPFPDTHTDGTAKAKVAVCTSSEMQKWNAPANLNQPLALTDLREQ
jgi:Ricin-type beta-trefoil lectin domain